MTEEFSQDSVPGHLSRLVSSLARPCPEGRTRAPGPTESPQLLRRLSLEQVKAQLRPEGGVCGGSVTASALAPTGGSDHPHPPPLPIASRQPQPHRRETAAHKRRLFPPLSYLSVLSTNQRPGEGLKRAKKRAINKLPRSRFSARGREGGEGGKARRQPIARCE